MMKKSWADRHVQSSFPHPVRCGMKILIVLFLCFLIGLERKEHKGEAEHYSFGGVRTFPLIGLVGYMMALLSGTTATAVRGFCRRR